jgi:branched-chain amino acid transport system substrate-binding protein
MKTLGASAEVLYAYQRANAEEMARQVAAFLARGGQSVLLVTGGEDTRNLAQVVRRIQNNVPLLGTPWAMPPSGVQDLGPLPEGLVFPCTWDPGSKAPAYLAFKKAYENRFGLPVDYHAVHAYEAMKIVALGLDRTKGKPDELPQALSAIGHFDGLQGPIQIDSFGDCQRDVSILKVVSGMPRQAVTTPVR